MHHSRVAAPETCRGDAAAARRHVAATPRPRGDVSRRRRGRDPEGSRHYRRDPSAAQAYTMAKVRPADYEDAINKGADTPCCNVGGCAVNTSGLFGLRTDDPRSKICHCFPRLFCGLLACAVNVFLAPFMFVINWIRIYVLPCLGATLHLMMGKLCCDLMGCAKCFPKYRDLWFPATDASVGYNLIKGPKPCCNFFLCCCAKVVCVCHNPCGDATVKWKRAPDIVAPNENAGRARLFEGKIESNDIKQGGLGDCWILSAIAALAEAHPERIRSLFVTPFIEPCGVDRRAVIKLHGAFKMHCTIFGTDRGDAAGRDVDIPSATERSGRVRRSRRNFGGIRGQRPDTAQVYRIQLYDVRAEKWKTFCIDDRIPMDDAGQKPRFTQPNGNELWVMLLEKAFAKMWGSYGYFATRIFL